MKFSPEKLFLPLAVVAAVIAVYTFFRKAGGSQTLTTPNPGPSGVPASYSAGGVVQPVNYTVPAVPDNPSPAIILANPFSANPGGSTIPTPPYLAYNLGPGNLLNTAPDTSMIPPTSHCGCDSGASCANQCSSQCGSFNSFPDGAGTTKLSTTRGRQLAASSPGTWQPAQVANLNAYLATENMSSGTPDIASWIPPGSIAIQ
jgi:hypothetical protein